MHSAATVEHAHRLSDSNASVARDVDGKALRELRSSNTHRSQRTPSERSAERFACVDLDVIVRGRSFRKVPCHEKGKKN